MDANTNAKKARSPRAIDITKGFSLWVMDGKAQIDTANNVEINGEQARQAAAWLNDFANWQAKS